MPYPRLDQAPAARHNATAPDPVLTRDAMPPATRRLRTWATCIVVTFGGLLALLALAESLSTDVSAATLAPDTIAVPDGATLTPLGEVVQALPFF